MNSSSSDSPSSSSSSNRNKSNTEASELYYAARLRPQPTQWRPLHSNNNNNNNNINSNSNNGESATGPTSRHRVVVAEQSNAADKSIILTWPRTREERPIWASRWQAVFVFLLFLLSYFILCFCFFYFFAVARAQKFPPLKVSRLKMDKVQKAITSTQLPMAVNGPMRGTVEQKQMYMKL